MQEESPLGPECIHGFSKAYAQFLSLESSFCLHAQDNNVWFAQYLGKRKNVPRMTKVTCAKILDSEG